MLARALNLTYQITLLSLLWGSAVAVQAQEVTNGPGVPTQQNFRLQVNSNITLTCPDIDVAMNHSGTAANQNFPDQTWHVKGNTSKGVTVTMFLASPFTTGAGDSDFVRRDARLQIRLLPSGGSPQPWTNFNSTQTLTTNIASGKFTDSWQSQSGGVSDARIRLRMTFVDSLSGSGFGTYAGGEYVTTVVGEVSENP